MQLYCHKRIVVCAGMAATDHTVAQKVQYWVQREVSSGRGNLSDTCSSQRAVRILLHADGELARV